MMTELKQWLDGFLDMGVPGFDIVIYRRGELLWRYMNGVNDLEKQTPMRGDERYNVYSCSKPITVTTALRLVEAGRLSLDDRLSDYLPEYAHMQVKTPEGLRPAKNPILIRHLFTMQAGFNYDCECPAIRAVQQETNGRCPTVDTIRRLAQEPLEYEPGEGWLYSLAHDVLAAVVEVVTGEKYEAHVKRTLFDPLGMARTTFLLPAGEVDSLCAQYRYEAATGRTVDMGRGNTYRLGSEYASGGAGCVTTVEDYIRFLEALRKGELLSSDTLRLMTTDTMPAHLRPGYILSDTHGYGLGVRCPREGAPSTDFGWDGAAGAFLAIDPALDVSLYYAQHVRFPPNHMPLYQIMPILKGRSCSSLAAAAS